VALKGLRRAAAAPSVVATRKYNAALTAPDIAKDRQIWHFAGQLPDYLDPVLFGHDDSGDDERRTQPATERQSFGSILRLVNLVPRIRQGSRDRGAISCIIVNDEDVSHIARRTSNTGPTNFLQPS
jgi:hypothetical protein